MLLELRIENLLVIERAELRLGEGLNAITGETGAGKTVLAHALDLEPRRIARQLEAHGQLSWRKHWCLQRSLELLVVGAAKAATTWLSGVLRSHSDMYRLVDIDLRWDCEIQLATEVAAVECFIGRPTAVGDG
jgi:hypothetical protein